MMLKCYVVDDEEHAVEVISGLIMKTPGLELIGSDINPLNAIQKIGDGDLHPDITFADIDMPQISGIDMAGIIGDHTSIIFTTAYPNFAASAFDKNALDYLLKPITYERFLTAVNKARERINDRNNRGVADDKEIYFFIKTDVRGKLVKIYESDIIYIEAKQNYIQVNLENDHYLTYLTLSEIEEKLSGKKFIRSHKSFIINLDKVKVVEGSLITLINNIQISLGHSFKDKFMESIELNVIKSKRS